MLAAYLLAAAAAVVALRQPSQARRWIAAILAAMWAWVGIVYQGIYFSRINPAAALFAAAFVVQSGLFAIDALRGSALDFRRPRPAPFFVTAVLILYATFLYPLIGFAVGEEYPATPSFGVTPCPLVIFTFGLLVWGRAPWPLWVIPLLWSAVGGTASLLLSVPQDVALPLSAVAAVLVRLLDRADRPNAASP